MATSSNVSARVTASTRTEAQHQGEDEVFEDQNREDEVGLVVGQAAKVDQPFPGDRARGDVDRGAEEQCGEAEAEGGHPHDQPQPAVHEQVDRPAEAEVVTAPQQAAEAELEADEEQEEDQADLRDEVGHLGRLDDRERLGLVRPEQEAGEQVRRNRRQAHAARNEPEGPQDGDGDRELGEGHRP